jgi:glutathione S-transferase
MVSATPVLWHIGVSHFSEKVRWALAYKGVEHERRAPLPGAHMLWALWLTRGSQATFPIFQLDGRRIGDSTRIIAELEHRWPQPPLYPQDPGERRRALDLEDHFDEQVGPHLRLLVWHDMLNDRDKLAKLTARMAPSPLRRYAGKSTAVTAVFLRSRFGAHHDDAAKLARGKVIEALDRIEAELNGRDYLVGDAFSVADLTAAALLYPLVLPPEAPPHITDLPDAYEAFREPLRSRPAFRWVEEMFRRHRGVSAEIAP